MTPNSLPGFLRRTIRNDSDEDNDSDHIQSDTVGSPASTSLMINASASLNNNSASASSSSSGASVSTNTDAEGNGKDINIEEDFQHLEVNARIDRKFRMLATSQHTRMDRTTTAARSSVIDGSDNGIRSQSLSNSSNITSAPDNNNASVNANDNPLPQKRNNAELPTGNEDPTGTIKPSLSSSSNNISGRDKSNRIKSYKEVQFDKIILSPVVDIDDLRKLAWNGIPPEHRPQTWKILLGYIPTNTSRRSQTLKRKRSEYRDAIAQHYDINDHSRTTQEQETLRQVLVDVPRTAPDIPLFRNDLIRQSLARLLYIWAMRHPASSYVQGINDLATPLFGVFLSEYFQGDVLQGEELEDLTPEILNDVEADVYWCLTNLLAGIQDHYTQDQPGVQRMVMRLEELVKRIDVGLTGHLEATGVQFMQFAFRWMNCLLLREFNLECIIRLWDTYLSEGDGGFETFHVYVCASFLCQFSGDLQGMQFDELFAFMQNMPTSDWDDSKIEIVLSQAFVLSTLFQGSDAHLMSPNIR